MVCLISKPITMKKIGFFLTFFLLVGTYSLAQQEDFQWGFGLPDNTPNECQYGINWIDFRNLNWEVNCVRRTSEGTMNFDPWGTNTSISTPDGELLFFTDGFKVLNWEYEIMENGDSLSPSDQLTWGAYPFGLINEDAAVILPFPERENQYVIIHQGGSRVPPIDTDYGIKHTFYSIVDMSYNNGLGRVTDKNVVLMEESVQPFSLNAIRHGNGRDWWIPIRHRSKPIFFLYLLDPEGIRLSHVDTMESSFSVFQDEIDLDYIDLLNGNKELIPDEYYIRDMRVSNNGDQLVYYGGPCVFGCRGNQFGFKFYLHRINFDRCTGGLSHNDLFELETGERRVIRSIEISACDRFLYVIVTREMYQFDLTAEDIKGSIDTIATDIGLEPTDGNSFTKIRRTPTGEMLVSNRGKNEISIIHNPELKGAASNAERFSLDIFITSWGDFPNHPNYRLGPAAGSGCDTLGIEHLPRAWYRYNDVHLEYNERRFTDISYFEPENWFWDFGDGSIFEGQHPGVHEFPGPGDYYVCLTVSNELGEDTFCDWVTIDDPTSVIDILRDDSFLVHPNPTTGQITIDFGGDQILTGNLSLINMEGKVL
ncbi:MAG: hypothetical protein EA362_08765, partial [Saprospirales bacterium]